MKIDAKDPDPYAVYSKIYDAHKGNRNKLAELITKLIFDNQPKAKSVLELACGTGAIAEELQHIFELVGLDQSPNMLAIAKKKMPSVQFIQGDMTRFRLLRDFDAIYCVHNSVNHLTEFKQWQELFSSVASHLKPNGIFIFDINTIPRMEMLTKQWPGVHKAENNYLIVKVNKSLVKPELYYWELEMFINDENDKYTLNKQTIDVSTYPVQVVSRALKSHFKVVKHRILTAADGYDDQDRAYFVCIKK